mmetsp:Transcript_77888/g.252504  ORF Transcript_77888/g.252504 Transcript_77888/m.252504 type:complete len:1535 (-) Transcript_77888:214-4818(-)
MLRELEKTAARKGLVKDFYDWSKISRDDIYRQRVLGTKTGAEDFIVYDDERRLGWVSLFFYIIFIVACMQFTSDRIDVQSSFLVGNAIEVAIKSAVYDSEPTHKTWKDVHNTEDLRDWLLTAFPALVTPVVQGFNFPIGDIRFTLRRMKQVPSDDIRFDALAPRVWKHKAGIDPESRDTVECDDTDPFGAYRCWGTNKDKGVSLGLEWCKQMSSTCPKGFVLDVVRFPPNTQDIELQCKRWCEGLTADGKPCQCFTLKGNYSCEFFHMSDLLLEKSTKGNGGCPSAENVLMPKGIEPQGPGFTAYWPKMKPFTFKDAVEDAGDGWRNTPGYVLTLHQQTQERLTEMADRTDAFPPTQAQALRDQLKDWVDGGLLSQGMATLVIDLLVHNPNYQVFTWCQIIFEQSATGNVHARLEMSPMRITADQAKIKPTINVLAQSGGWDYIYIALLALYVLIEIVEFVKRGSQYFKSPWNCFMVFVLLLQITTLVSRTIYMGNSDFTRRLGELSGQSYTNSWEQFYKEFKAFENFRFIAAANLLLLFVNLVHLLSDLVPRVHILANAMYRAITPIVFAVIVIANLLIAFCVFGNLMFGRHVSHFSSLSEAMSTCTEYLFVNIGSFQELRAKHPVAGSVFFISYMILFYFIAQSLSKAIVLASYDDAVELHVMERKKEELRAKAQEPKGKDRISRWVQKIMDTKTHIKETYGGQLLIHKRIKHGYQYAFSPIEVILFIVFLAFYLLMVFYMAQVGWSFEMTNSITKAIREPQYTMSSLEPGQMIYGNNFDSIRTREDVMAWLHQALPQTMFGTSQGTFEGVENMLKTYSSALPDKFDQLVINDWNLVLGQQPVRISARYHQVQPVPAKDAISDIVTTDTRLPNRKPLPSSVDFTGMVFLPEIVEVSDVAQIRDQKARAVLSKHCGNKTGIAYGSADSSKPSGFSCMLSVTPNKTALVLNDMAKGSFINNQTALVAADFMVYNGYAEAFTYVAVVFKFQPSGTIDKDILTYIVRSSLYTLTFWYRIVFEIMVVLLNSYFLGLSLSWSARAIIDQVSYDRKEANGHTTSKQRIVHVFRAVVVNAWFDPWTFLDLVSSLLTFVLVATWFDVAFAKIASPSEFFFPERPLDDSLRQSCQSRWCSDNEVLSAFHIMGLKHRVFMRVCGLNTVLVMFRILKYLHIYQNVQVLFTTFRRAFNDLFWCVVIVMVLFTGFVAMGHHFFGIWSAGFRTMGYGMLTCFQLFLGTYNYSEVQQMSKWQYYVFSYSFIVVFRFILLNMFFAITDKHYTHSVKEMGEPASDPSNNPVRKLMMWREGIIRFSDLLRTNAAPASSFDEAPGNGPPSPRRESEAKKAKAAFEDDDLGTAGDQEGMEGMESAFGHGQSPGGRNSARDFAEEDDQLQDAIAKKVKSWKSLPVEMQIWAFKESKELDTQIDEWHKARVDCKQSKHQLESTLEEAAAKIALLMEKRRQEADDALKRLQAQELSSLKEIHQDQESLAWYIMKQEAKLKKLEAQKETRQQRNEKMKAGSEQLALQDGEDPKPSGA